MTSSGDTLLRVENLHTHFPLRDGTVKAVDGVSFSLDRQVTVGLVGESGCGKSIMAQSILQIQSWPGQIVAGSVLYYGNGGSLDLAAQSPKSKQLREVRGKGIAYIHQEPMAALSLLHTVGSQILEAIHVHDRGIEKDKAADIAVEMLERVGIPNARSRLDDYIFNFSGGMRQRVMIAMALVNRPQLLIADEPTTAVDVTIQAQILELLSELKEQLAMSVMIITHDLGVIAEMADEVMVMYLGKIVEHGPVVEIFDNPKHPYTRALIESIPSGEHERGKLATVRGTVPDPYSRPSGCAFRDRCDHAMEGTCDARVPALMNTAPGHDVRCFLHSGEVDDA
jgi:peptide/nickel transport system ATP-binding protein